VTTSDATIDLATETLASKLISLGSVIHKNNMRGRPQYIILNGNNDMLVAYIKSLLEFTPITIRGSGLFSACPDVTDLSFLGVFSMGIAAFEILVSPSLPEGCDMQIAFFDSTGIKYNVDSTSGNVVIQTNLIPENINKFTYVVNVVVSNIPEPENESLPESPEETMEESTEEL